MTTYADIAYDDETVEAAVREAGFKSFRRCVAEMTTLGHTLTDIAETLKLSPPRLWAYYQQWCRDHAEPLRLGVEDDD